MSKLNKLVIPIEGMHCRSCELLVEEKLAEIPEVKRSEVNYKKSSAEIFYAEQKPKRSEVEEAIRAAGYTVGTSDAEAKPFLSQNVSDYKDLGVALLFLLGLYLVLKSFGITSLNIGPSGNPSSLPVVFLIGITAGFSTCMALIGGLILGISARHSEKHPEATAVQKFRPHIFFNLGRVASYTVLGGLLGSLGSLFQLSSPVVGALTILVGFVMLVIGLKLTGIFPRLEKTGFVLPKSISRILGIKNHEKEYSHRGSAMLGALTFFLPCGFTQAMQLYAVSTGNFWQGGLIMGVFALGTTPGLLGIGGITSVVKGIFAKRFFKFAGLVVIVLSVINITTGYSLTGWQFASGAGSSNTNSAGVCKMGSAGASAAGSGSCGGSGNTSQKAVSGQTESSAASGASTGEKQIIKTTYVSLETDIVPNNFTVKAGAPVRFEVTVEEDGVGCMSTIMVPGLYNTPILLEKGKPIVMEFTPKKPGTYKIACAMGVPRGTITVK